MNLVNNAELETRWAWSLGDWWKEGCGSNGSFGFRADRVVSTAGPLFGRDPDSLTRPALVTCAGPSPAARPRYFLSLDRKELEDEFTLRHTRRNSSPS